MDIRRIELWEGRSATYMSNNSFSVIIEDQGEVTVELSSTLNNGARVSPLSLPYFRGTGSGVLSDENGPWWRGRQGLYQAGGFYFNYPESSDSLVNTSSTYWSLKRYGTENENHGVWKYSEMKSRELGNRFFCQKVDLVIPNQNVLYTAIKITNNSEDTLEGTPSWQSMLSTPLIETGSTFSSNAHYFTAFPLSRREAGRNRFITGKVYEDLKKFQTVDGTVVDASIVPSPTGTYDYILGKVKEKDGVSWISVMNPKNQLIYIMFTPSEFKEGEYQFPNAFIAENWYGRMDAPWALFDGATPEVMAATIGFNSGPKGTKNFVLLPGESKTMFVANAFYPYSNSRISLGFYQNEITSKGFNFRRTKSSVFIEADTTFQSIRKLAKRIFFLSGEEEKKD